MLKKFAVITLTLILSLTCLGNFSACKKQQTITDLGIPSAITFETGEMARCAWDIKVWKNKLYVGSGDYSKNTGPTEIYSYDLNKKEWTVSGIVPDEAIIRFNVIDKRLIIPGTDPMEDWELGNYYELKDGEWQVHRVLPNAVHTFDVIKYKNLVVAGIGTDGLHLPTVASTDKGQTFSPIDFFKDGQPYDLTQYEYSRAYELFVFKNKLYALVYHKCFEGGFTIELFEFIDGAFHFVREGNDFFGKIKVSLNLLNAKAEFKGKFFYSADYLYVTDDLQEITKVPLPNNEYSSQFKVIGNKIYILCYQVKNDGQKRYFTTRMYESRKGTEKFKEIFCFDFDAPPLCFDKKGNTYYVGMGDRVTVNDINGTVFEVKA